MGNNYSSNEENLEYIHSPKQNCPIKPFPIKVKFSKPIDMKNKKESISLPCSFEEKIIKQKQEDNGEGKRETTMGRQISPQEIGRYYIASTYFKNYQINDRQQLPHSPSV